MNALSMKQKEFLYKHFTYGRLRIIAKPCYDLIIWSILLWNRCIDCFYPKDPTDLSDLTIIIKTFERDRAVRRLVKSIKQRYPSAQIMVVNDSKEPTEIAGVENLILPYDVGISVGRNTALEKIKTTYFLLLDDDFVFSRRQNLGVLLEQMTTYPEIDILGGRYIDLPFYITHNFQNVPVPTVTQPKLPIGTLVGENRVVDKVQNYFLAKTESVRNVKWNDALKTQEHTDFFMRAKGELVTAFRDDMLILHAKTPFDLAYLEKRFRIMKRP